MEFILIVAVAVAVLWWLFFRDTNVSSNDNSAPYKVETPNLVSLGEPPSTVVAVNGQITDAVTQQPAWHTAPAAGTPLAENSLDVNHDGKVDLDDIKEVITKKPRKPRTPKAEKPAAKKAAPKKAAAMKATKKPRSKKA